MPPIMGQVASGGGLDQNAAGTGNGGENAKQGIEQVMAAIRETGQQIRKLGEMSPMFASEVQQMMQVLMRMRTKAAQVAPQQQPSADALPGGG